MPPAPGDWSRMRELFDAALALPAEQRSEYLSAQCGENHALRDELRKLLDSHEAFPDFLEPEAAGAVAPGRGFDALEGRRLGPYQVLARVGAGGMGEVYKCRDTRLQRTVAIKILSARIAGDPAFRARFQREAQAVAALNDPHICTLYDVGQHAPDDAGAPLHYLVMEYVEGETLASRLTRGRLPIEQSIAIGRQIATALDRAHRAGIVHRDLKPGNVMLTKRGIKLLDFGLAKAERAEPAAAGLTETGIVLGTLNYMAPEQLASQPTDVRTDIFSLGVVLSEMFTGRTEFVGAGRPSIDRVIRKCVARDPDERWQSAGDLATQLQWLAEEQDEPNRPVASGPSRSPLAMLAAAAALLAIGGVASWGLFTYLWRPAASAMVPTVKKFVVSLTDTARALTAQERITIAPDGSALAYLGASGSRWRIHIYTFADERSQPIPGTEGGRDPFFSPDGKWLAYFSEGRLMKVAVSGGPPAVICNGCAGTIPGGGSWGADDQIIFSGGSGLQRVPASGGQPAELTRTAPGEAYHLDPRLLPDGTAAVFTVLKNLGTPGYSSVEAVSIATGVRTHVLESAASAMVTSTHLLYASGSNVLAVPFDARRLLTAGTPAVVLPDVLVTNMFPHGAYDVARDGTLVYLSSTPLRSLRSLIWADRQGGVRIAPGPQRPYFHPVLLPDERTALVEVEDALHNIWRADLTTGALTPLTHDGANHRPVVSADGRSMIFSSDRTTPRSLFRQPTDSSGIAEQLTMAASPQNATAWSRDGKWLAFTQIDTTTRHDIWMLPMDGERTPQPFLQTPAIEESATFSPDGSLVAYTTNASGRVEVMMTTFPEKGPHVPVSTGGGEMPVFSADGRTILYRSGDRIMAADVATRPALRASAPRHAFAMPSFNLRTGLPNFALTRKGDEVLTVKYLEPDQGLQPVHVVVNWLETLRRPSAEQ
jgi:Tol biopolymer transport system component/tRNA A-37 threonylcarbamoyl transferase component Bud32